LEINVVTEVAELHPAWVWDCPECGIENFARSVVSGMTLDEEEEMRSTHVITDDETGFWQTAPGFVECFDCGRGYEVKVDLPGN
jgi:hypothetical protein